MRIRVEKPAAASIWSLSGDREKSESTTSTVPEVVATVPSAAVAVTL